MLEAVDRRLLGEHVLDALLLRGVVDVDLGPVVEVEVVALLFLKKGGGGPTIEREQKREFFLFPRSVEREIDVVSSRRFLCRSALPLSENDSARCLTHARSPAKTKKAYKKRILPQPSSAGSPGRGRSTRRGSGTGPCRPSGCTSRRTRTCARSRCAGGSRRPCS